MKATSEMTKLNFITDQGSSLARVSCACLPPRSARLDLRRRRGDRIVDGFTLARRGRWADGGGYCPGSGGAGSCRPSLFSCPATYPAPAAAVPYITPAAGPGPYGAAAPANEPAGPPNEPAGPPNEPAGPPNEPAGPPAYEPSPWAGGYPLPWYGRA